MLVVCVVGCSVPTPIGELQSDIAGSGSDGGSVGSSSPAEGDPGTTQGATQGTTELTASSEDSSSGSALAPEMVGFAIRWGDIPAGGDTETGMSEVGSGPGQDPDAILVVVGFTTARCEDVFPLEPCGTWNASFTLAPDQQLEGSYDGATINAGVSEIGPGDDPQQLRRLLGWQPRDDAARRVDRRDRPADPVRGRRGVPRRVRSGGVLHVRPALLSLPAPDVARAFRPESDRAPTALKADADRTMDGACSLSSKNPWSHANPRRHGPESGRFDPPRRCAGPPSTARSHTPRLRSTTTASPWSAWLASPRWSCSRRCSVA